VSPRITVDVMVVMGKLQHSNGNRTQAV